MTAIAYKDGCLAVESAASWSDMRRGRFKKWCRVPEALGGGFVAGCGNLSKIYHVLRTVEGTAEAAPTLDIRAPVSKSTFLLMRPDSSLWQLEEDAVWYPLTEDGQGYFSAGSAMEYLAGAMDAGASAVEAVRLARDRMEGCGGQIYGLYADGRVEEA